MAVTESGTKTKYLRFGRLGKTGFYGPFGINILCCKGKRYDPNNWYVNTWLGIKALRGTKGASRAKKRKTLMNYNKDRGQKFEDYFKAVIRTEKELRLEADKCLK